MTVEELNKLFEGFQEPAIVGREKSRTVGMFIRLAAIMDQEDVFEVTDQVDYLVSLSEKDGFKYGFTTAFQLLMNRKRSSSGTITDITAYLQDGKGEGGNRAWEVKTLIEW